MTPEPQAAPEPLTAEEEAKIRRRHAAWATAEWDAEMRTYEHPETECSADRDRARLLATLDAARASQAAPVASGALDATLRAALVREAMLELQRQRGRLSKVTVGDVVSVLDNIDRIAALRAAAHPDTAGALPDETRERFSPA